MNLIQLLIKDIFSYLIIYPKCKYVNKSPKSMSTEMIPRVSVANYKVSVKVSSDANSIQ